MGKWVEARTCKTLRDMLGIFTFSCGHGKPLKDFNHSGNRFSSVYIFLFSSVFLNSQLHSCLENEVEEGKGGIRIIKQEVSAIDPEGK